MLVIAMGQWYPNEPLLVAVTRQTPERYYGNQVLPATDKYGGHMSGIKDKFVNKSDVIAVDVSEGKYYQILALIRAQRAEKRLLDDDIAAMREDLRNRQAWELAEVVNE